MRTRFLGLAFACALVGFVAWLSARAVDDSAPIARAPAEAPPQVRAASAPRPDSVLPDRAGTAPPTASPSASGPCPRCAELELSIAELERRIVELGRRHEELRQSPDNRASGVLATLSDLRRLTERERTFVDCLVRDVPVVLLEGEAEWIARHVLDESGDYDGLALVSFLGRERVLDALDPLRLELFRDYHFTPASWSAAFPEIPYDP